MKVCRFFYGKNKGKSLHSPLNYLGWTTLPPNYKTKYSTPKLSKPVK